jgi:hypothetical protein
VIRGFHYFPSAARSMMLVYRPRPSAGLMSHKHQQLIRAIFREPISGNIHWREVDSLLHHLGAAVEPLSGTRVRVRLNGVEDVLHRQHHSNVLDRHGVRNLRAYLACSRVTPSQYETGKPGASAANR